MKYIFYSSWIFFLFIIFLLASFFSYSYLWSYLSDFLQYMNSLTYLSREAFSSIPSDLVPDLQKMLSSNETFRPTASDFTGENMDPQNPYMLSLYIYLHVLETSNLTQWQYIKRKKITRELKKGKKRELFMTRRAILLSSLQDNTYFKSSAKLLPSYQCCTLRSFQISGVVSIRNRGESL